MEQLLADYKKGNVILFVGAGVSMNLGLPSWSQLVDHIATELGYDPDIYRTFGSALELAEYYKLKKGKIGPLRSWMDRMWHSSDIDIKKSKVHEYIAKANFPIIYTTNYDRWIETALSNYGKEYTKISSVSDIAKIDNNKTQIIKFHGDFDDDSSIVLDETSYFQRLEFETPLDIKFRSDVLGKSVLFIGYSLSDINIRLLFYKLSKLWKQQKLEEAQPKSYIFLPRPNPIQEEILEQWRIGMISSENDNPGESLEEFLKNFVLV
ncbi:SIR2 family NAD-dependent protein deacylase [Klebsiella pneumoniae]|nr:MULTISPECIES: SIR2 family protein [Klebsiella]HCB0227931.1 SIR2 family protein [Klebsiella variicola subsp. variicola]HDT5554451.1 SIR2 family protein [Klebsiella pneumoniae subsp. ozaenae]EIW3898025.1 SIR2 family protein [Klebsiella pneumoniae]EIX9170840.1 SIR2 family protein [Klebsiella pneumoniae]EIY1879161.1 SIR2 family protein [Klebsiella pneumoniae]